MIEMTGLDGAQSRLKVLKDFGVANEPLMHEIGNMVFNRIDANFRSESYYGERWKPLKDKGAGYRGKKKGKRGKELKRFIRYVANRKILQDTGRLGGDKSRWSVKATENSVTVGTPAAYGKYHQGDSSYQNKGKVPRRPFMPMDEGGEIDERMNKQIIAYLGTKLGAILGG